MNPPAGAGGQGAPWSGHRESWPRVDGTMSEYGAPVPLLARYAVMVDAGYIFAAAGRAAAPDQLAAVLPGRRRAAHPGHQQARRRARPGRAAPGLLVRRG